jgi:hypothetical protein
MQKIDGIDDNKYELLADQYLSMDQRPQHHGPR